MAAIHKIKLSTWRQEDGDIVLRAASPDDDALLQQELEQRVSPRARRFDAESREWRIAAGYETVMAELFSNYTTLRAEETQRRLRQTRSEAAQRVRRARRPLRRWGLTILLLGALALLYAAVRQPPVDNSALHPAVTSTATRHIVTVSRNANLRAGPGLDYAVVGGAMSGQTVTVQGYAQTASGERWLQLDNGRWIYAELVTGAADDLPLITPTSPANANNHPAAPAHTAEHAGRTPARVVYVYDGDTIAVELGGRQTRVRYLGMDTPEVGEPWHDEATQRNRRLVAGLVVYLEVDKTDHDRYGRLLRHVFLDDGTLVGEELVAEGLARAMIWEPDVRYAQEIRAAEAAAQTAQLGLWRVPSTP